MRARLIATFTMLYKLYWGVEAAAISEGVAEFSWRQGVGKHL